MGTDDSNKPTTAETVAIGQNIVATTIIAQDDMNAEYKKNNTATAFKIARQIATMNRELANAHIQEAVSGVRDSAKHYKTAVQLQETGKHVGQIQQQLLRRNEKILANLSSDSMTAKRVSTINQQHAIQARVATYYLQLCSSFFGIAIVLMFVFSLRPVRDFFRYPFAVMQILLLVLTMVLVFIILYRVVANRNHYQMLYQERVFPKFDNQLYRVPAATCPVIEPEDESIPDDTHTTNVESTCPPLE
jgi:hypothetical protein